MVLYIILAYIFDVADRNLILAGTVEINFVSYNAKML